jgi:hypothetical protein
LGLSVVVDAQAFVSVYYIQIRNFLTSKSGGTHIHLLANVNPDLAQMGSAECQRVRQATLERHFARLDRSMRMDGENDEKI